MKTVKILSVALACIGGRALAQPAAPQRLAPVEVVTSPPSAVVDLGAEFPQMKGYVMSQTLNSIPPGQGRAMHSHAGSPEIVRVLSGTLTEAHNGGPPSQYGPGSIMINAKGTQHMWANLGSEPVVFLATSVRAEKPKP